MFGTLSNELTTKRIKSAAIKDSLTNISATKESRMIRKFHNFKSILPCKVKTPEVMFEMEADLLLRG